MEQALADNLFDGTRRAVEKFIESRMPVNLIPMLCVFGTDADGDSDVQFIPQQFSDDDSKYISLYLSGVAAALGGFRPEAVLLTSEVWVAEEPADESGELDMRKVVRPADRPDRYEQIMSILLTADKFAAARSYDIRRDGRGRMISIQENADRSWPVLNKVDDGTVALPAKFWEGYEQALAEIKLGQQVKVPRGRTPRRLM